MGLNPFDQPDVEAAKVKTVALADAYEKTGALGPEAAILKSDGIALYADPRNTEALAQLVESKTLDAYVRSHLKRAHKRDYVGLLFYLDRNPAHREAMRKNARRTFAIT